MNRVPRLRYAAGTHGIRPGDRALAVRPGLLLARARRLIVAVAVSQ